MENEKEAQNGRFKPGIGVLNMATMSNGGKVRSIKGTIVSASFPVNEIDGSLRKDDVDVQIITELDANSPRIDVHLNCDFDDEMYGRTLVFNGFMRGDGVFIADSVDNPDNIYDMSFSEEEIEQIKQASKDPDFFKNLIRSIAPSIVGMDDVKKILALQLFGGVEKTYADKSTFIGNISVLIPFDPDTAVYSLIKAVSLLSPRSLFLSKNIDQNMKIQGDIVKEPHTEKRIQINVGAATIANHGIVCLDYINYIDKENLWQLRCQIEEGKNFFTDGKYSFSLTADTAVLCGVPPIMGRIVEGTPAQQQIDLYPLLLSRFDFIIPVRDVPDIDHDKLIAEGILNKHLRGNAMRMEDSDLKNEILDRTDGLAPVYPVDFIRRYVAYARLYCKPVLQESAVNVIKDEYLSLRKSYDIFSRQLETIIRISEASARSRLSDIVDENDAKKSISLFKDYLTRIDMFVKSTND